MNSIKKLFLNNYKDFLSLFSLLIVFIVLTLFFSRYLGNIIIDCGREAFFPAEILKGKILYKDLFNIFGPLSYQINSLFYLIFGTNLKALRIAGALNSGLIICLLYFLTRLFASKRISWIICLFIIISCIFSFTLFNYIFPYSYAIVYALSSFLFSVLFLLLYLKTSKSYLLPLAWFFMGSSFAFKYEYVLYAVLLFFISILKPPKNKKYIFISFISFLFMPVLSYSFLFFQGLDLKGFLNNLHFLKLYILSPSLKYLYKNFVGFYPKKQFFFQFLSVFKTQIIFIAGLLWLIYLFLKPKSEKHIKNFLITLTAIFYCYLFSLSTLKISMIFCWMPLFTLFIFIFLFARFKKNTPIKDFLSTNNGIYLVFILCALLGSLKTFFYLHLCAYGTYTLPLLFIVNSVFLVEYIPEKVSFINKEIFKRSFFYIVIILAIPFIITYFLIFQDKMEINTARGTVYDSKKTVLTSKQMIDYINRNLNSSSSIWVVPEGTMINFLTNHPSNGIYYAVNTPYLETFGEEKIISDTEKNPPDYIIITNAKSECYAYNVICKDYGFKLCNYIKSSYFPIKHFGDVFSMLLYKRK